MHKKHEQGKFNEKVEEGYFLGYITPNKRVYNRSTQNVEEWYHVDVQRYSMPPPGKCPDWMFDYSGHFDSFNMQLDIQSSATSCFVINPRRVPGTPTRSFSTEIYLNCITYLLTVIL